MGVILKRFKGTEPEYRNLHYRIKLLKKKPKSCFLCKLKGRLELANISQKYINDVADWEYMCGVCHKRHDSKKYRWLNGWRKTCTKCQVEKSVDNFYKRKGTMVVRGKKFNRKGCTEWCKECTKNWSKKIWISKIL